MIKWKQCGSACLTSAYSFCLEDRDTVLSYGELEINEGGLASITYESLQTETDMMLIAEARVQLLEYCELWYSCDGSDIGEVKRSMEWGRFVNLVIRRH